MWIVKHRKFFIGLSLCLMTAALVSVFVFGLKPGIDFRGGVILEVVFEDERPPADLLREELQALNLGEVALQPTGEKGLILRLAASDDMVKERLLAVLSQDGGRSLREERFSAIGPSLGRELYWKGVVALALVVVLILFYVALAFRRSGFPVAGEIRISPWKYGAVTIFALIHDLLVPTGIFAWLGQIWGWEVDALFLTALLTILGLSVNDTIVVFDRIRENLKRKVGLDFAETVGRSLEQTFMRSLNTSMTVIFVLLALLVLGGSTTQVFVFILLLGMIFGTYSSIFLASPLLVVWQEWREKEKEVASRA